MCFKIISVLRVEKIKKFLYFTKNKHLRFVASTKWKTAMIETALRIRHADDQMLGIYGFIEQWYSLVLSVL